MNRLIAMVCLLAFIISQSFVNKMGIAMMNTPEYWFAAFPGMVAIYVLLTLIKD